MRNIKQLIYIFILFFPVLIWPVKSFQAPGASPTNEYFDYTYALKLNQQQVKANEIFTAHLTSQATCKKPLPVKVTSGIIAGKVTASLQGAGSQVTLNPNYSMQIDGIPDRAGESFQKEMDIPLKFSTGSRPGIYEVTAQITSGKFKALGMWFDGTSYLPSEPVQIGTIEYTTDTPDNTPGGATASIASSSSTPVNNTPPASSFATPTIRTSGISSPLAQTTGIAAPPVQIQTSTVTQEIGESESTPWNSLVQIQKNAWLMIGVISGTLLVAGLIVWRFGLLRWGR